MRFMTRPTRLKIVVLALLGVTLLLWVTALLFQFRVVNLFDRYLMKFPGPWVVFGAMLGCPFLAAVLGRRMSRLYQQRLITKSQKEDG